MSKPSESINSINPLQADRYFAETEVQLAALKGIDIETSYVPGEAVEGETPAVYAVALSYEERDKILFDYNLSKIQAEEEPAVFIPHDVLELLPTYRVASTHKEAIRASKRAYRVHKAAEKLKQLF